jgi:hypothetical protein
MELNQYFPVPLAVCNSKVSAIDKLLYYKFIDDCLEDVFAKLLVVKRMDNLKY